MEMPFKIGLLASAAAVILHCLGSAIAQEDPTTAPLPQPTASQDLSNDEQKQDDYIEFDSAAISVSAATQGTIGVVVVTSGQESASFTNSGNQSTGIQMINQDAGNANSQANMATLSLTDGTNTLTASGAFGEQILLNNSVTSTGGSLSTEIIDSFNDSTGYVAINQAAGAVNQQLNLLALSLGEDMGASNAELLGDSALSHISISEGNILDLEEDPTRHMVIEDSFNGFQGVAQVNQTAGHFNQVSNTISASVRYIPSVGAGS